MPLTPNLVYQLKEIDTGVVADGAFYLFTLRLVPLIPFFVINLVMGLTGLKTRTFYWVSQVGMFAGTLVYVNAGHAIGQDESLSGILSPAFGRLLRFIRSIPFHCQKNRGIFSSRR